MRDKGFTLIELIMTLAIIGLLASVTLPLAELAVQRSKEQELRVSLRQIRGGLDAYKQAVDEGHIARAADKSGYPPNLQALVDGVPDIKDPDGNNKLYFLRRIPPDPMARNGARSAAETWGIRSYRSPADDPREGDDVFDVYSMSGDMGLNGIPYRKW